ncbi:MULTISPECIES: hypothetical protein [Mycolicibacterium]|uniref:hypothetical protein n=1 Tax=Mycolicibacterium TaxID=1866885 RepID=UPI0007EB1DED|nr:hypothetical protein [Mycolicibacterium fortuitum]OBG24099.1 hypothetical protein A5768_22265 [Mycolicibacterium fortuitum]
MHQVYKITWPNGKIYVGSDVTGTFTYFGSPSEKAKERIRADHAEHHGDVTIRKQILWESDTATKAETLAMERQLIVELGANNPETGYNLIPKFRG